MRTRDVCGHRQLDHTADLALELWANDEASLLRQGALALAELLSEGARVQALATRTLELSALDAEDRLVRFLNEVLSLAICEGFLCSDADVTLAGENSLSARLQGEHAANKIRREIKSVTYHELVLERDSERCLARVVIDV